MFILRLVFTDSHTEEIVVRYFSDLGTSPAGRQQYYYEAVDDLWDEGNIVQRSDLKFFEIYPLNWRR